MAEAIGGWSLSPILSVTDLVVRYGDLVAVNGLTFELAKGECVGIVGANGAGKSSLMKAIVGLVRLHSGTVVMGGNDITGERPWTVARRGLCLVPEGRELFSSLSVDQHLRVAARRVSAHHRAEAMGSAFRLFPALGPLRDRKARFLSGGEQQMLAVARAMVSRPVVLLLDEPTLGLAPTAVAGLIASLKEIRASGVSIAVAEQSLKLPLELCDRVYVCSGGRFVAEGEPQEVLTDAVLRHAYLGV